MIRTLKSYVQSPADLTFLLGGLLVISMTFSPFLLSVAMWGLAAAALWQTANDLRAEGRAARAGNVLARVFSNFFRNTPLLFLSLLLLIPAVTFFWSEDHHFWLERVRVRIPFLVLPLIFSSLPVLSKLQYRRIVYLLLLTLFIISIGVGINFALHAQTIIDDLGHGRPVPVPRHHIRFNLMLATGILAGGWLWLKKDPLFQRSWERGLLLGILLLLFAFIHLLSVRSGIAALYLALLFTLARFVLRTRQWKIALIALFFLLISPVAAYYALPSLQERIAYMIWDWQQYQQNAGDNYSDAERWISLKVGLKMWTDNFWIGVGVGDLPSEIQRLVSQMFPAYTHDPRLPHNQFIYILAGSGMLGLIGSLLAFAAPFFGGPHRRFYLFAVFQIMVFLSFMVEYTIETSIGVAWYLFYTLWFRKMALAELDPPLQASQH